MYMCIRIDNDLYDYVYTYVCLHTHIFMSL